MPHVELHRACAFCFVQLPCLPFSMLPSLPCKAIFTHPSYAEDSKSKGEYVMVSEYKLNDDKTDGSRSGRQVTQMDGIEDDRSRLYRKYGTIALDTC